MFATKVRTKHVFIVSSKIVIKSMEKVNRNTSDHTKVSLPLNASKIGDFTLSRLSWAPSLSKIFSDQDQSQANLNFYYFIILISSWLTVRPRRYHSLSVYSKSHQVNTQQRRHTYRRLITEEIEIKILRYYFTHSRMQPMLLN